MKQDPMNEWVLREELLAAFHRWPFIVLFALVGILIGLLFAYLSPSSYRASVELSVELNPYRVLDDQYIPEFAGVEFRNIDDYKHWQMLQLSTVVLSDPYIHETLIRLREKNSDWSTISDQDLRKMLSANWRNAGLWRLVANGSTSKQAAEAVEIWKNVILEKTLESIASSRDLFRLELALRSLNNELMDVQLQQAALEAIQAELEQFQFKLSSTSSNEILSESDRLELFNTANQLTGFILVEQDLINKFPQAGSQVKDYLTWLEKLNLVVKNDLSLFELRYAVIRDQISKVSSEWADGLDNASGLAATLNLEDRHSDNHRIEELHSYSLSALIGGLLGLLVWIMVFLIRVTRKGYR